jgi:hypothetical protein
MRRQIVEYIYDFIAAEKLTLYFCMYGLDMFQPIVSYLG